MTRLVIIIVDIVLTLSVLGIFLLGAYVSLRVWQYQHDEVVDRWSQKAGYRIVSKEPRVIGSPWILYPPAQRVYRVVLEDRDGRLSNAWVRSGGAFLGPANPRIDVHWASGPEGH
jgi:hypothetical protein